MEKNPLDVLIPNHKELSREEIGKEIFKFVNKNNNDPEIIKQNDERVHNGFMKLLGIKNDAPPRTLQDVMRDFSEVSKLYNSDSENESESESDKEDE